MSFTVLERYELKYWVPPQRVPEIRAFVEMFLVPEFGGAAQANVSLYLDDERRSLYQAHVAGAPDRFKLRVRRYGTGPSELVFAEIKRKVKDVVVKTRAVIPSVAWAKVIEPTGPVTDPLLEEWAWRVAVTRALPQLIVSCRRTAWVPTDILLDTSRVTLDEDITAEPYRGYFWDLDPAVAIPIDGEDAHRGQRGRLSMLELKFTHAAPRWMGDLVRRFELQRTNYSKFVAATKLLAPLAAEPLLHRTPLARAERSVSPDELYLFGH